MDAGEESRSGMYGVILDRFRNLEASHAKLREQFDVLVEEQQQQQQGKKMKSDSGETGSDSCWGCMPPAYFSDGSRHRSVLDWMGHAVHVTSAASGEIIYWNRSAEKLYGWKDVEVLGQIFSDLLIDEEYYSPIREIMEGLSSENSWSGQFPFKKKSGEIFMAIVTKSLLYEDGELLGVITVSSDAAVFNNKNSEPLRTYQGPVNDHSKVRELINKKIQWQSWPQITSVPQIASSVSNLASKVLSLRRGDDDFNASTVDGLQTVPENATINLVKHETLAAKVLSKLRIRGGDTYEKEKDGSTRQSSSTHRFVGSGEQHDPNSPTYLKGTTSCNSIIDNDDNGETFHKSNYFVDAKKVCPHANGHKILKACEEKSYIIASSRECHDCFSLPREGNPLSLNFQLNAKESYQESHKLKALKSEDAVQRQSDVKQFPSPGESNDCSHGSSSSKGEDNDSNLMVDCEIHWEDLHLGEKIGQGSYAVVYRGIWNGSDVAIKVFFRTEYHEETLLDYKKEIDIMKRLRHPNVLLFMGAVYSQDRLAIVTEILPRGSLFKALHKNNQSLDIRRRLRISLDIARGMNYLHHRNPPIVHRDLKSSNLLVDRNWTVKVGDFGLSRLKYGTFLTAKSGTGTPQWMAPEVLRSEPSNEKSDVFSFGVILWELMTECIPWNNLDPLQVVGVVGFMDRRLDIPETLDPRISSIIKDCWLSSPGQRPSFEEIIQRMTEIIHKVAAMSSVHKSLEP